MSDSRPLTSKVKRAAWTEPGPKIWLLLAVVSLLGAAGVCVSQWSEGMTERRTIAASDVVDAKVTQINGQFFLRDVSRVSALNVALKYTPVSAPSGSLPVDLSGQLTVAMTEKVSVGDVLKIRVNRDDPSQWTDQLVPLAWMRRMALPVALGVVGLALVGVAAAVRSGILRTFRTGEFARGKVARVESIAIAPMGKQLTLTTGDNKRVVKALWPQRLGSLQQGDEIDLIVSSGNSTRALVAQRYLEA